MPPLRIDLPEPVTGHRDVPGLHPVDRDVPGARLLAERDLSAERPVHRAHQVGRPRHRDAPMSHRLICDVVAPAAVTAVAPASFPVQTVTVWIPSDSVCDHEPE